MPKPAPDPLLTAAAAAVFEDAFVVGVDRTGLVVRDLAELLEPS